jgi:hypothetical protein
MVFVGEGELVVPLDFLALGMLRVDSLHAASALAIAIVFSFVLMIPFHRCVRLLFPSPFFPCYYRTGFQI